MKKKSTAIILLSIVIFLFLTPLLLYFFREKTTYTLNLPDAETIQSIEIRTLKNNKFFYDTETIKEILDMTNEPLRKTTIESIQDWPVNASEEISIIFNCKNETTGTFIVYLYKRNNNYYIEQPYNGIYPIRRSEYQDFISYFL